MIEISTRPLRKQERLALEQETKPVRPGCISAIAYYGSFLFLLPLVVGGFIGNGLRLFGLSENVSYSSGIFICLFAGVYFIFRENRRINGNIRQIKANAQSILSQGIVETVLINDVAKAWMIVADENDSVGMVLQTEMRESVLLLGESLDWLIEDGQKFPAQSISVERYPVSNSIVNIHPSGDPVSIDAKKLPISKLSPRIDTHLESCCIILPSDFDPQSVTE